MKLFLWLFITLHSSILWSQNSSRKAILKTLYQSIEKWDSTTILKKYSNKNLIEIIEGNRARRNNDKILKNGSLDLLNLLDKLEKNDTIFLQGYAFSYIKSLQTLKRNHKRKLEVKPLKLKRENTTSIKISTPILSLNQKIAAIYYESDCGPLCGSGGFFIFSLKKGMWIWEDKITLYLS